MGFFSDIGEMIWDGITGRDGILGIFVSLIMTLVIGGLSVLLLWGAFYLSDTVGQDQKETVATVYEKTFTPEHYVTTFVNTGNNVIVPINTYVPDTWSVTVSHYNETSSTSVSQEFYNTLNKNDRVRVLYKTGRISGGFYVTEILSKIVE